MAEAATPASTAPIPAETGIGAGLTLTFAAACGLVVANIYFAQPLAGPIGRSLQLPPSTVGLIVTITQIGYAVGLVLLVPLGDLVENRRLIVTVLAGAILALAAMAAAPTATVFFIAAAAIGLTSVVAQMLVPFAAQLAPAVSRGRVVGNVMSGLMIGILLSRTVASLIADRWGWRAVFGAAAAVNLLLVFVLRRTLPIRHPGAGLNYARIIRSLGTLLLRTPVLQRRASYQATLFGAFSLFWTGVPLLLEGPIFQMSQRGIAWFALAGSAGAFAAPIAGRVADRGWTRAASGFGMALTALAFGLAWLGAERASVALLVVAALVLDFGVTANLILGQRAIFSLAPEIRSRLNGLFIALFFLGGAAGSALAGMAYARAGWTPVSAIGCGLAGLCLVIYSTEFARHRTG